MIPAILLRILRLLPYILIAMIFSAPAFSMAIISVEKGANPSTTFNTNNVPSKSVTFTKKIGATSTLIHISSNGYAGQTCPNTASSTFAGGTATVISCKNANGGPTNVVTFIYATSAPVAGTYNVIVNWSSTERSNGGATSFTGASTYGATSTNSGASGVASISITTQKSNSVLIDTLFYDVGQTMVTGAGQTKIYGQTTTGANFTGNQSWVFASTSPGTNKMSWTHVTSSDWNYAVTEITIATIPITPSLIINGGKVNLYGQTVIQ